MAIDTRDKRFSLLGIGSIVKYVLPAPDGSFSTADDRAHLLYLYRGIDLSSGLGDINESQSYLLLRRRLRRRR